MTLRYSHLPPQHQLQAVQRLNQPTGTRTDTHFEVRHEEEQKPLKVLEAAIGFEPMHRGFADLSLNHLGTPPPVADRWTLAKALSLRNKLF
jgi:hypothetical protein